MESKIRQLILKLLGNKFPYIIDVSIEHRYQDDYPPYIDVVVVMNTEYLREKYNLTYYEYYENGMDQYGNYGLYDFIWQAFDDVDDNLRTILQNIDDVIYFTFKDYISSILGNPICVKYMASYICKPQSTTQGE